MLEQFIDIKTAEGVMEVFVTIRRRTDFFRR